MGFRDCYRYSQNAIRSDKNAPISKWIRYRRQGIIWCHRISYEWRAPPTEFNSLFLIMNRISHVRLYLDLENTSMRLLNFRSNYTVASLVFARSPSSFDLWSKSQFVISILVHPNSERERERMAAGNNVTHFQLCFNWRNWKSAQRQHGRKKTANLWKQC